MKRSPILIVLSGMLAVAARAQEADELINDELVADGADPQCTFLGNGGFVDQGDADPTAAAACRCSATTSAPPARRNCWII